MTQITFEAIARRLAQRTPARISETGTKEAAVSLVLVPGESTGAEILFIKRAEVPGDPWSGQMALPGGRRQSEDPDLLATAAREAREEIGVDLSRKMLLGELDDFAPRSPLLPRIVVRPYVFALNTRPRVTLSPEATLHLWVSLEQLRRAAGEAEVIVRSERRVVPSFRLGPHIVWGLTERIISPFLELALRP